MIDLNSSIAWHRARLDICRSDLTDYESGRMTVSEIAKDRRIDLTPETIADLKRKIAEHEHFIAAYEKHNAPRS